METRVVVVSLGRIVADRVRVDPTEAFAVLQQLWQRVQASAGGDHALLAIPPLDAMGITPFGDFEVRRAARTDQRSPRSPQQLSEELGALWLRLLASADPDLTSVPRACVDAARRTSSSGLHRQGERPIETPDELMTALEAFRPGDPSVALAALYARWIRTTDRHHPTPWDAIVAAPPMRDDGRANGLAPIATPGSTASPSRRSLAALVALACLILSGIVGWQWGARQRGEASADRVMSDRAIAPPEITTGDSPATFAAPSTEVEVTPTAARVQSPMLAVRARRLLHAGRTGRAPYSPSFDPHANAIVFHAGRQQTALLQASLMSDGAVGEISTVRNDGSRSYHAQISPDGERLAYDSDVGGTRGVYIANRDGSSPKRVSGSGHASVPTWSPDGRYVAFARAEPGRPRVWNVWTVDVSTSELRRHTAHRVGQAWGASWFPDARRIAYSLEDRLIVRDLERGVSRVYATHVAGRLVRTPAVSPDGQRIVFQVYRDGAWVLDLRTGSSRRLLADASAEEFAWSPDGHRVAYHSMRGGEWGIWMLEMPVAP